jgi:DTW domain-containing protein
MRADLCLCAKIEQMQVDLRFVLVMHTREANKPTNTGFLVRALLPETEIRIRGLRERVDVSDLSEAAVLFPMPGAEELRADAMPRTLIVPDGTWRQARDAVKRELLHHRHVTLPPGEPGQLRIRVATNPHQLSTLEAIARVVALRDATKAKTMLRVFRMMVDRTLWIRGDLPTEEVFGGLPDEVIRMRGK